MATRGRHSAKPAKQATKNLSDKDTIQVDVLPQTVDRVVVRMYCLGTGDCFLIKYYSRDKEVFTMLIDCGACRVQRDFKDYVQDLYQSLPRGVLDLLVVTHEHNDHVNGFETCYELFERIRIKEAWFAWTEDPADPTGKAQELRENRNNIRKGVKAAMDALNTHKAHLTSLGSYGQSQFELWNGLAELATINLSGKAAPQGSLPGMHKIKELLKKQRVDPRYLFPGKTITLPGLEGIRFHVLGPPGRPEDVYKTGKQGRDVFSKVLSFNNDPSLAQALYKTTYEREVADISFSPDHILSHQESRRMMQRYFAKGADWRSIESDWLISAGALAMRLNSHINNTSLVLAIESSVSQKVLLFPGDAEYGSWQSWAGIDGWTHKGQDGSSWAEDLLRRTVFYKVSHHLSFNGTSMPGILLMEDSRLVAMATLDLERIITSWSRTMPNPKLLEELLRRTNGRLILMNEKGVAGLGNARERTIHKDRNYKEYGVDGKMIYKEYTISLA